MAEDERLSEAIRLNLTPTELARLKVIAVREDRSIANVARRAIRNLLEADDTVDAKEVA